MSILPVQLLMPAGSSYSTKSRSSAGLSGFSTKVSVPGWSQVHLYQVEEDSVILQPAELQPTFTISLGLLPTPLTKGTVKGSLSQRITPVKQSPDGSGTALKLLIQMRKDPVRPLRALTWM